ncbi:MAG TPA: FtsX-like permease family protein [Vicinamibacterales bacterium]|nr:FtsX-like permease family protein [Vicinamibacterales bacterium]
MGTAWTYALRSLRRNARRTTLSIVGIGIGCALALFMESLNRGRDELFARMGAYGGAGHVRIVPDGWRERRDPRLRLGNLQADVEAARHLSGVAAVTVRARAQALVAMGTHVVPVEIVGVDPGTEPGTNRFARNVSQGRYLQSLDRGAVVIGQAIADRLLAGLEDEILATAVGKNGDIESTLLRIVGIVHTGSDEIDATICHVVLADVERLTGLSGAGEVTLVLEDWERADLVKAALSHAVHAGDEVLTWGEINPEFKGHLEQDNAVSRLVSGIILLIVMLGVASAQLAAVLERRREFAVLSALGVHSRTIVAVLLQEALVIGIASAALGLLLGLPFVWALATRGIDLSRYMGASYSFQGVLIEPVIYGDLGAWTAWYVLTVAVVVTVIASLYPAWFASRSNPADALRVA